MPIYGYECQECGRRSEEIQRLSDAPLTECSDCGGALKKLISSPAIQFKGSGWYVTDYGKSGGAGKGSEGGGDSSSDSSGGDGKGSSAKGDTSDKSLSKSKGDESKGSGASKEAAPSKES